MKLKPNAEIEGLLDWLYDIEEELRYRDDPNRVKLQRKKDIILNTIYKLEERSVPYKKRRRK